MTLASDRLVADAEARGEARGEVRGGNKMLYKLVQDGDITIEKGAEKMGVSNEQFVNQMTLCGYKAPGNTTA